MRHLKHIVYPNNVSATCQQVRTRLDCSPHIAGSNTWGGPIHVVVTGGYVHQEWELNCANPAFMFGNLSNFLRCATDAALHDALDSSGLEP